MKKTKPTKLVKVDKRVFHWMTTFAEYAGAFQLLSDEPRKTVTCELDVKAFAAFWFIQEATLLKIDLARTFENGELADSCFLRLMEWARARGKWHELLTLKECPEQHLNDKEIADAAFAGLLMNQPESATDSRVNEFLNHARANGCSKAAWNTFKRWTHEPRPAAWKYPLLDSWLICIWPLVERHQWSYRDVWLVAQRHFEEADAPLPPLETARRMGDHCSKVLKLQTSNHKAGRPRNDNDSLPKLAELAWRIPAELPDNSLFSKIAK